MTTARAICHKQGQDRGGGDRAESGPKTPNPSTSPLKIVQLADLLIPPNQHKPSPAMNAQPIQEIPAPPIPSRLLNGKANPEYDRAYRAKRKAAGVKVDWNASRKTPKGKAWLKAYNASEKGRAARARYEAKRPKRGPRLKSESAEAYAARIMRDLERQDERLE